VGILNRARNFKVILALDKYPSQNCCRYCKSKKPWIIRNKLNKFRKLSYNTDGKIELFILSHLIDIPIVVYDNFSNVKFIFLQGEIKVTDETIKNYTKDERIKNTIFIKFDYDGSNKIPKNIYSIYYK
jgi:hypothetical protein